MQTSFELNASTRQHQCLMFRCHSHTLCSMNYVGYPVSRSVCIDSNTQRKRSRKSTNKAELRSRSQSSSFECNLVLLLKHTNTLRCVIAFCKRLERCAEKEHRAEGLTGALQGGLSGSTQLARHEHLHSDSRRQALQGAPHACTR